MLGLSNQISCHHQRISRGIRQNQTIRGTSHHIDAHPTKQNPLGFGHKLIARSNKNIRFRQAKQTKRHRGNPLHPTKRHNPVCASDMRRIDDCRRNPDLGAWRRTGYDILTPGDLCGGDRHNSRGNVRISATGNVTASCLDRDAFLTGDQAGNNLVFDIGQRGFLRLSKAFNVVMRKANVRLKPFRDHSTSGFNLSFGQLDITVVIVKLTGIFQRCFVATLFDLV